MEIHNERLVHKTSEAEKPRDLASASWGHRKASDVCSSVSLKAQKPGTPMGEIPVPGEEKMSHLKQAGRKQRREFLLPVPFVLFRPSMDWAMSLDVGESNLPQESTDSSANLIWKHLHIHTQK